MRTFRAMRKISPLLGLILRAPSFPSFLILSPDANAPSSLSPPSLLFILPCSRLLRSVPFGSHLALLGFRHLGGGVSLLHAFVRGSGGGDGDGDTLGVVFSSRNSLNLALASLSVKPTSHAMFMKFSRLTTARRCPKVDIMIAST